MKRVLVLLLLVVGVGMLGWLVWRRWQEGDGAADGPPGGQRGGAAVAVEVVAVRRGEIRDLRWFTGTIEPRASYVVAPKIGGRLEKLSVNLGDTVSPADLIALLDDEEYRQQVAQARAALEVAKASVGQQETAVALAERERERVRRLWEQKATSETIWDAADAEYHIQVARHRVALAQMSEKEAALRGDEVRLSYTRIHLPEDATGGQWFVAARHVDEGTMLAANIPLVTVVDLARVIVVIHVIERDYPRLRTGQTVEIETDAHRGRLFVGQVVRVAPALQAGSRQARVEIEVDNAGLPLRPGMFARVSLEFGRRADALLVPRAAVVVRDGRTGVFMANPTTATVRFHPVTVEIQAGAWASVTDDDGLSGLVVTLGHHLLSDGAAIVLPPTATVNAAAMEVNPTGREP